MNWFKNLFEKGCKCKGCKITRMGWGYAPCSKPRKARPSHFVHPPKKP